MAKLLDCSEEQLTPIEPGDPPPRQEVAQALASAPRPGRPPIGARPVLGFSVDAAGIAHITLDARLPIDRAMPLFRLLLDAHVVTPEESTDE